jgi:DNA topoisomerase-1
MVKKSLVIVESPTKAKTISKFLGGNFVVTSSMGHVRDLPKSKLGVDTEHGFEPKYVVPAAAKALVTDLKLKAKNASEVILATDEDREGEAIAWHLAQTLKLNEKKLKRIVFHEITKTAIAKALESPRGLDKNLIDAQQARRVLDRLVGYKLSPFLWKKVMRGLSAGRVQSAAVRLIMEREEEISNFKPQEYWKILATLEPGSGKDKTSFFARLIAAGEKQLKKFDIATAEQANQYVKELEGATYQVATVETKETRRHPAAPFTTSTLQQECAHKFGYTARQTMMIAQQLYEGIELGEEGSVGLISYMRTDSVNLAEDALKQIREVITKQFGKDYALAEPRYFKNKSKNAQEAHEAIRPTDVWRTPDELKKYLDGKQYKIYSLIWKRAVACQMPEAVFDQTTADIAAKPKKSEGQYLFRATGQVLKFDGFTKVYGIPQENGEKKDDDEPVEGVLPELAPKQPLDLLAMNPQQSFTEPPARYTDASLIKALEEDGIGRPSTYAPIISTILARKYVERKERKFFPTEIGTVVNNILVENFPQIVDLEFTANMENGLDEIAEGKRAWQPMIAEFYEPFERNLAEKTESVEKHVEETDIPCPTCGKKMIIKYGRFGKFLACPDYPTCKTTQPLPEEKKQEDELKEKYKDEKCPICGKPMNVRRGRFGYFLGCPDYPKCKGIKKIEKTTGQKCPKCGEGDIVQKKNKRGTFFYACNRYPKCDYTANKLPETEATEPAKQ